MGKIKKKPIYTGRQKFKAEKKIRAAGKKGRLNKDTKQRFTDFKNRRNAGGISFNNRVAEDWLQDRQFVEDNAQYEEMIPLDMLSAEEKSARRSSNVNRKRKISEDESDDDIDKEEVRRFKEELEDDEKEMLPLKIDGSLIRRITKMDATEIKDEELEEFVEHDSDIEEEKEDVEEDLSELDPIDRLVREKELLAETENRIYSHVKALQLDPHSEVNRLGDLIKIASGQRIHSAVREDAQLLATSCATQAFIDTIPGYHIRALTEEEKSQKMKKDTRQVISFEENLLLHYLNFLKLLEKHGKKLVKSKSSLVHEGTFTTKLAMLSAESLARLLSEVSHFNYATNLVTCFVNFGTTAYQPLFELVATTLSYLFKSDVSLQISLHGVKAISALVSSKKSGVPPRLLGTFLLLNIRNVDRRNHEQEKEALNQKKFKLRKERRTKTVKKFDKQLKKVESDLQEVEASERLSTKLKLSTEIMKHVFATYFRVLRKMPGSALISPTLAGLSRFAHLINIDFFDDLIRAFEELIERKQLKTSDSLLCVRTVCVILSGEGKVLNIDPLNFYRSLYNMIPLITKQKIPDKLEKEVDLLCECTDFMINQRKKLIPFPRVISFIKRLLLLGFKVPDDQTERIIHTVRTHFIAHSKLLNYIDEEDDFVANGIYKPDLPDPDCCNSLSTNFVEEFKKYEKHPSKIVQGYIKQIREMRRPGKLY